MHVFNIYLILFGRALSVFICSVVFIHESSPRVLKTKLELELELSMVMKLALLYFYYNNYYYGLCIRY